MKKQRFLVGSLGIIALSATVLAPFDTLQAHAATSQQGINQNIYTEQSQSLSSASLDNALVQEADTFIKLQGNRYIISNKQALLKLVGQQNFSLIQKTLINSNNNIKQSKATLYADSNDKTLSNVPKQNNMFSVMAKSSNGVTKVQYYWWGLRIYLSKSDARNLLSLGTGVAVVVLTSETGVGAAVAGVVCVWLMDHYVSSSLIKTGLIIDYNTLLMNVTRVSKQ